MSLKKLLTIAFYIFTFVILITGFAQKMTPNTINALSPELSEIKLIDQTKQSGIDFVHHNKPQFNDTIMNYVKGVSPFYESISSSVSVVDINNDRYPDFFVPSSEWGTKSKLYINQKDGTFKDQAEKYGLADLPFPTRAGFFDCDNDGTKEMLLTTYKCPILYKQNKDGEFYQYFNFQDSCTLTTAFNIFDYNHDGLLDIVIAPFSRTVPNNWHDADNGPGNVMLFKNIGNCQFKKVPEILNEHATRFTHALGVGDFRGLNKQDIWAATDFSIDRIFFEIDGKYEHQPFDIIEMAKAHNGMGVSFSYFYDNKIPSVYISQLFEPGYATTGNQFWTFNGNSFTDSAYELGINQCYWSWGSNFSDINNDGKEDLIVANGFISGDPNKNYWRKIGRIAFGSKRFVGNPWNWSSFSDVDWSGHKRDCVFIQTEHGFKNISENINFDSEMLDGRGVASLDYLNNGKISFLVSNQKQALKFYKNETTNSNHWIGFKLKGIKSNRDAIGSNIWVKLSNGKTLRKAYYPFNGYSSQSDDRIHFGIGKNLVSNVKIRWPNGNEQTLSAFKVDSYNLITEE